MDTDAHRTTKICRMFIAPRDETNWITMPTSQSITIISWIGFYSVDGWNGWLIPLYLSVITKIIKSLHPTSQISKQRLLLMMMMMMMITKTNGTSRYNSQNLYNHKPKRHQTETEKNRHHFSWPANRFVRRIWDYWHRYVHGSWYTSFSILIEKIFTTNQAKTNKRH